VRARGGIRPRPHPRVGVAVRRAVRRRPAAAHRAGAGGLGLDGLAERPREARLLGRPRDRPRALRPGRRHGRHVGTAAGGDVGVLGPLLRRGLRDPLDGLPRARAGAERLRPRRPEGRPGARHGLVLVPGTTVPGTTVPGTTVPGTTVPGTTVPGTVLAKPRFCYACSLSTTSGICS